MKTTKFIHLVGKRDIMTFKRLLDKKSCFFSDSEAFINSYVINNQGLAWCFNDKKNIFFFNRFNEDAYFFCCPKGIDWQNKLFEVILNIKNDLGKNLKKIWLWELTEPIDNAYFDNRKIKSVSHTINKRYISYLSGYKDIERFLKKEGIRKIKQQWNRFFNNLYKHDSQAQIFCKSLSKNNYRDSLKILNRWRLYTKENEFTSKKLIDRKRVFKKDLRMIKDVLKNPRLYESLILYYGDTPMGINIAFKVGKTKNLSGGVFCADRIIPGTSEVLKLLFFEKLAKKGYLYYNWGNSYLSSINKFKLKFFPTDYEYSHEYFINFKS